MKKLNIVTMTLNEYMKAYGEEYNDGNLFDYPIEELEYIMQDTDIEKVALIDGRLYEI